MHKGHHIQPNNCFNMHLVKQTFQPGARPRMRRVHNFYGTNSFGKKHTEGETMENGDET